MPPGSADAQDDRYRATPLREGGPAAMLGPVTRAGSATPAIERAARDRLHRAAETLPTAAYYRQAVADAVDALGGALQKAAAQFRDSEDREGLSNATADAFAMLSDSVRAAAAEGATAAGLKEVPKEYPTEVVLFLIEVAAAYTAAMDTFERVVNPPVPSGESMATAYERQRESKRAGAAPRLNVHA